MPGTYPDRRERSLANLNFPPSNHADLRMIEEMGISPDRSIRERRPRLRSVIWLVIASVRMKKMQREWAVSKKLHASLVKTVEQVRRRSRKSIVI
jgi:hypothetical protein